MHSTQILLSIATFSLFHGQAELIPETITNVTDASHGFSAWRRASVQPQLVVPLEPQGVRNETFVDGNTFYLVYNPGLRPLPFQLEVGNETKNARESWPRTNFLYTLKETLYKRNYWSLVPRDKGMHYRLMDKADKKWVGVVPHEDLFLSFEQCKPLYSCLFFTLARLSPQIGGAQDQTFMPEFRECVTSKTGALDFMVCPLVMATNLGSYCDLEGVTLSSIFGNLTIDNDIKTFADGGPDSDGQWWPGTEVITDFNVTLLPSQLFDNQSKVEEIYKALRGLWWPNKRLPFATALGQQALGDQSFQCSLASPCSPTLTCGGVGARSSSMNQRTHPSTWAYLALVSLKNINSQLSNEYIGVKGSAILASLKTISIQEFFPQPKSGIDIGDIISAFAGAFAMFSGIAPGISQGASAVAAVGGFLAATANPPTQRVIPQEIFADSIEAVYQAMISGLDYITDTLFTGGSIGNLNIVDMMAKGAWVENAALQRVSNIEEAFRVELISRSIDRLWKTPTSNKMFVLFVQTPDCAADTSGPPDLKYCGDGGVYYSYNFIEGGDGIGYLGYPWGAEKMRDELKIEPQVRDPAC